MNLSAGPGGEAGMVRAKSTTPAAPGVNDGLTSGFEVGP
jgi:hypothetical protein